MGRNNKEVVVYDHEGNELDRFSTLAELSRKYNMTFDSVKFILKSGKWSRSYGFGLRYEDVTPPEKCIDDPDEFAKLIPLYPKAISNDGLSRRSGLSPMAARSKVDVITNKYCICEDDEGRYSRMKGAVC